MSASTTLSDTIVEIRILSEIERNSGVLVEKAEGLLDSKRQALIDADKELEENQLRNVMAVASNSRHIAVVTNFIKYQMGRNEGKNPWNETTLGSDLIDALNDLKEIARKIAGSASDRVDEIHIKLARLFLGYLSRYFVYLNQKEIGPSRDDERRKESHPGRQDKRNRRDRR